MHARTGGGEKRTPCIVAMPNVTAAWGPTMQVSKSRVLELSVIEALVRNVSPQPATEETQESLSQGR